MTKLLQLFVALAISTQAIGQEATPDLRCKNTGALVIGSWHRLDVCVLHKQIDEAQVSEARRSIAKAYPKIEHEIAAGSALSVRMKAVANAMPYDFSDGQNVELLAGVCKS